MKGLAAILDQFEKCSEPALKGVLMAASKIVVDCFQAAEFIKKYEDEYNVSQVRKTFQKNLPIYAAIMSKPFLNWLIMEVQYNGSLVNTHAELTTPEIALLNAYKQGAYDSVFATFKNSNLLSEDVKFELFLAKVPQPLAPYEYMLITKGDTTPQVELEQTSEPTPTELAPIQPVVPESIQGLYEQVHFIYTQCVQQEKAIQQLLQASLKTNEITREQYDLLKTVIPFTFLN